MVAPAGPPWKHCYPSFLPSAVVVAVAEYLVALDQDFAAVAASAAAVVVAASETAGLHPNAAVFALDRAFAAVPVSAAAAGLASLHFAA